MTEVPNKKPVQKPRDDIGMRVAPWLMKIEFLDESKDENNSVTVYIDPRSIGGFRSSPEEAMTGSKTMLIYGGESYFLEEPMEDFAKRYGEAMARLAEAHNGKVPHQLMLAMDDISKSLRAIVKVTKKTGTGPGGQTEVQHLRKDTTPTPAGPVKSGQFARTISASQLAAKQAAEEEANAIESDAASDS